VVLGKYTGDMIMNKSTKFQSCNKSCMEVRSSCTLNFKLKMGHNLKEMEVSLLVLVMHTRDKMVIKCAKFKSCSYIAMVDINRLHTNYKQKGTK
jgi:hypothetical protein